MDHTGFDIGVQEPELAAVRQGGLDEIAIASLNDPLVVAGKELTKQSEAFFQRFASCTPIPSDFITMARRLIGNAPRPKLTRRVDPSRRSFRVSHFLRCSGDLDKEGFLEHRDEPRRLGPP